MQDVSSELGFVGRVGAFLSKVLAISTNPIRYLPWIHPFSATLIFSSIACLATLESPIGEQIRRRPTYLLAGCSRLDRRARNFENRASPFGETCLEMKCRRTHISSIYQSRIALRCHRLVTEAENSPFPSPSHRPIFRITPGIPVTFLFLFLFFLSSFP